MNHFKLALIVFSIIIGAVAMGFLYLVDWKVAVGVWLWSWSINLEKTSKDYD